MCPYWLLNGLYSWFENRSIFVRCRLKKTGHGNAGASNATLSLGWKYGILVAIIDIGKGVVAIIGIHMYFADTAIFTEEQIWLLTYTIAAGVILGHNFSFHMGFNRGKGTASIIGILLAVDWIIGLLRLYYLSYYHSLQTT